MVKQKWSWLILLVASYYFYISWEPAYLMLIVFSTLVDYFVGKRIFKTESNKNKNILIGLSLFLNFGFLFKYFNFFSESLNVLFNFILILWSFFQKLFIADRLALYVDPVFNNLEDFNGTRLWVASCFFAFKIYCDFAGYTNIARGCAKVLGINLSINFKQPYLSSSISEFWRKWHITLSSWFKEYVYIPLGENKVKTPKYFLNLMIVFLVSGLWHGSNWTFVIWGVIHGALLVIELIKRKKFNFKMPFLLKEMMKADISLIKKEIILLKAGNKI